MNMIMKGVVVLLGLLSVIGVAALLQYTKPDLLMPSDTIQIITLAVLVIVTIWYAISTHRIQEETKRQASAVREQTEISRQAVEIALNTAKNSVLPIVNLSSPVKSLGPTSVFPKADASINLRVHYKNIGKGPALNLRAWLRYDPEAFGEGARSEIGNAYALGAGEEGNFVWSSSTETLPLLSTLSGFDIVAEYEDIYRRKFRTTMFLINEFKTELSFTHMDEE